MSTWYAAPSGSSGNSGSIGSPWSLVHVLSGAGGGIHAGDTVYLRGGTYSSTTGFVATASGSSGNPITYIAYPSEVPVLDGAYPEFTTIGNSSWEVHDVGLTIWRSVASTFSGILYGHVKVAGIWYPLAIYETAAVGTATSQYYSSTTSFYPGPGIRGGAVSGKVHIRLEAVGPDINGARDFPILGTTNPADLELRICGATAGITVYGDHLVFDGLVVNDYERLFHGDSAATTDDITIRNCSGRCGYFVARIDNATNWTFEDNTFDGNMYHDDWWVWGSDIKGTLTVCDNNRKCIFDISGGSGHTITSNTFSHFFDGIIAAGNVDNTTLTYNTFNDIWDDAWQLVSTIRRANIGWNRFYGAAISHDATGTGTQNPFPATIWMHHNVIDTTINTFASQRASSAIVPAIIEECIPLSIHGFPNGYPSPWKIYHNTFVFDDPRSGGYLNLGLYGAESATLQYANAPHEVMNNIIHCTNGNGRGLDIHFYSSTGREIYDGNVLSGYAGIGPIWRFIYTSTSTLDGQFNTALWTISGMRGTQAFTDSQVYYAPGWEASGMEGAADLDAQYKPRLHAVKTGAVDLTATGWPGTNTYEAWRGAIDPSVSLPPLEPLVPDGGALIVMI